MGLFSTTNHYHRTEVAPTYPQKITAHEHRAPTDESVRLLNEMDEKARKNIIERVILKNTLFEGTCILYEDQFNQELLIDFKFIINGVKILLTKNFPNDAKYREREWLLQQIYDHFSAELTAQVMSLCIEKLNDPTP